MKDKGMRWTMVLLAVLLIVPGTSWAFEGSEGDGRRELPPEAIDVCKDKSAGTEVEISTPRGEKIKATCKQIDGQIVAVPEGGFRGPKGTPPGGTQGGA